MIIVLGGHKKSLSRAAGSFSIIIGFTATECIFFCPVSLFFRDCHVFPIRMKLWILISKLCTNEFGLFH